MNSKGTFLYPAIVDRLNQSQTPADVYTKTESDAKYAKLATANTFTQTNTFNEDTNFNNTINFKNPSNGNGAFLDNFDFGNNLTSLKFTKNPTKALLILEVDNNSEIAKIECPNKVNGLSIHSLANPTNANDATNKAYVDSKVVFLTKNNLTFTRQQIEANKIYKYYTNSIPYRDILPECTGVISVACSDIPVNGQHLVITYFPKRGGDYVVIEIYQYNSNTDITSNLHSANFQFVIQKSI